MMTDKAHVISMEQAERGSRAPARDRNTVLRAEQVFKKYPGSINFANSDVSVSVYPGELHAILGENGAGKSTLLKMLYGLEKPDAGRIVLGEDEVKFRSPAEAIARGIGLVPQHVELVDSLTVAQNVVLGKEPTRFGFLDQRAAVARTRELAVRHGLPIDPEAKVADLSIGVRQRIEILKTLHRGARILLMDEPTALLSPAEVTGLFQSINHMKGLGLAIVLISHKIAEVRQYADRFTVLRSGCMEGSGLISHTTDDELASLIVGAATPRAPSVRSQSVSPSVTLSVRNVTVVREVGPPILTGIDFDIAQGEILGVAGVEGNGQDYLSSVISGLLKPDSGEVLLHGEDLAGLGVRHAQSAGVGCIPQDRLHSGVAKRMSLSDNAIAVKYRTRELSGYFLLDKKKIRKFAEDLISEFQIKTDGPDAEIALLSGGNIQKVIFGRELGSNPKLLLASQPTRGVDMGAAQLLHERLIQYRNAGGSVLLVSSDLEELLSLSDRIIVVFGGKIVGHFEASRLDAAALSPYMTGIAGTPGTLARINSAFTDLQAKA